MPIINSTSTNIPFLNTYVPYQLDSNLTEARSIRDMVSYEFAVPSTPRTINYYSGAETSYEVEMSMKNLTDNAEIEVSIKYNTDIFNITSATATTVSINQTISKITKRLRPTEIGTFKILSKNRTLNSLIGKSPIQTELEVSMKNLANGLLVVKQQNISLLSSKQFSENTTVT
jgi:hypothetical protein